MSLRIINDSDYETGDLRDLVAAAIRISHTADCPHVVRIRMGRGTLHGYACYPRPGAGSNQVRRWRLMMPATRPVGINKQDPSAVQTRERIDSLNLTEVRKLAQIALHEIRHTSGQRHREMPKWWTVAVPWADSLKVRRCQPKAAVRIDPVDRAAKREAHARAKVGEVTRRIRLLTTRLRKWKQKVRYYERRTAMAARPSQQPASAKE